MRLNVKVIRLEVKGINMHAGESQKNIFKVFACQPMCCEKHLLGSQSPALDRARPGGSRYFLSIQAHPACCPRSILLSLEDPYLAAGSLDFNFSGVPKFCMILQYFERSFLFSDPCIFVVFNINPMNYDVQLDGERDLL